MSIQHHPTDDTLLRYASGALNAGLSLVTQAHLHVCAQCRAQVTGFEAVGGALLDAQPPAALAPTAFADVLARLDGHDAVPAVRHANLNLPPDLPSILAGCDIGRWWWFGRGIRYSKVRLPWAPEANVMLLRVAANRAVFPHTHAAHELTLILRGGYTDSTGTYGPGDMADADDSLLHQPSADDEGCLCLAALEGPMRLDGWLGRWQRRLRLY
jgi:putative transcriptional regulator